MSAVPDLRAPLCRKSGERRDANASRIAGALPGRSSRGTRLALSAWRGAGVRVFDRLRTAGRARGRCAWKMDPHLPAAPSRSPSPRFTVTVNDVGAVLSGSLDAGSAAEARRALAVRATGPGSRRIELSALTGLDTAGAVLVCSWQERGDTLVGLRASHRRLVELIGGLDRTPSTAIAAESPRWRRMLADLGRVASLALRDLRDLIEFGGRAAASIGGLLLRPAGIRPAAIAHHVVETGVKALPIVGLLAVMISVVIAYQGVAQLRPYGGQDLTIDLVAVSVLREMAVLITAILVAGRSGAAFAAEIGVMQSNEEVDALTILGLDAMELLVAPRLIALVLALTALTFFADVMGLLGGAAISRLLLDVAPAQYLLRVRDAVDSSDLFAGLIKAPVFAVVIAVTGCMHGLRVEGSAESVGTETTRAVVKAIFLVIVLDAMFSILFEKVGI
ncbi:MAG TPA: MlaE family lipid ABC transporter permease subunit [Myxococcota bacterium]